MEVSSLRFFTVSEVPAAFTWAGMEEVSGDEAARVWWSGVNWRQKKTNPICELWPRVSFHIFVSLKWQLKNAACYP
jgi:hypothetical protein